MPRAHTAKSIGQAVQTLQSRVETCQSTRAARRIAESTRENCLVLLAREMELLEALRAK